MSYTVTSHIVLNDQLHIVIEPAKTEDIDRIAAIENRSYTSPWSRKILLNEIDGESSSYVYVARLQNGLGEPEKIIGYNFFWLVSDEVHILNIAVDPDYRGYGCGKHLMDFAINLGLERGATSVLLEVRVSNMVAQQLYSRLGFQRIGIRKKYYTESKEDAYVMKKQLLN
jgi:ribosomal-protein-alanine N-acetyltransferase